MFTVKLANLTIAIENRYPAIEQFCKEYRTDDSDIAFTVRTTDAAIHQERMAASEPYSDGYLEILSSYREIGTKLPEYDALLFHAAVIEVQGKAYAFTAPGGTGKTTHISHWRRVFGKDVLPINGDKPILRYMEGHLHACGTPWAGKEHLHRNVCVPLGGICFLRRGETDTIRRIDASEILPDVFSQIFIPKNNTQAAERALTLADRILKEIPLYAMSCTDSENAAKVAAQAMLK